MSTKSSGGMRGGYKGNLVQGLRHGQGSYEYPGQLNAHYTGAWERGHKHGKGTITLPGAVYEGDFTGGQMTGSGIKTWFREPSCQTPEEHYEGEFWQGERHGYGIMTYKDGSVFRGNWELNSREGEGSLVFADGSVFQGMFSNNQPSGAGQLTDANKQWTLKAGFVHGDINPEEKGTIEYTDGAVYEGLLKDFKQHGYGILRASDASPLEYEGEWANGSPVNIPTQMNVQHEPYVPARDTAEIEELQAQETARSSQSKQKGGKSKGKKKEDEPEKLNSLLNVEAKFDSVSQLVENVDWAHLDVQSLPSLQPPLKLYAGSWLPRLEVYVVSSSVEGLEHEEECTENETVQKFINSYVEEEMASFKSKKGANEKREELLEEFTNRIQAIAAFHPSRLEKWGGSGHLQPLLSEGGRSFSVTLHKTSDGQEEGGKQGTGVTSMYVRKDRLQVPSQMNQGETGIHQTPWNNGENADEDASNTVASAEDQLHRECIKQISNVVLASTQQPAVDDSELTKETCISLPPTVRGRTSLPSYTAKIPAEASGQYVLQIDDTTPQCKYGKALPAAHIALHVVPTSPPGS
eukprot:gb/GECG01012786.1/.p1 GENE.gb/GECG01012786.1/~~gb/GECG01012786.1/.p1  ORF type:complete len:578 (+),score=98.23 gb/GECG01012786.1/:1-1734(+)